MMDLAQSGAKFLHCLPLIAAWVTAQVMIFDHWSLIRLKTGYMQKQFLNGAWAGSVLTQ